MVVLAEAEVSAEAEEVEEAEVDSMADLAVAAAVEAVSVVEAVEISVGAAVAEEAEVVSAAVALEATPNSGATTGLASHVEITTLHSDKRVISAVLQEEVLAEAVVVERCEVAAEDLAGTDTSLIEEQVSSNVAAFQTVVPYKTHELVVVIVTI